MLDHLRQRIAEALARTPAATLASHGPAGLQASVLPCRNDGATLYVLVPLHSEHLVNLSESPDVVVVSPGWQLRGAGRVIPHAGRGEMFAGHPDARWSEIVEIQARRVDLLRPGGSDIVETIDVV